MKIPTGLFTKLKKAIFTRNVLYGVVVLVFASIGVLLLTSSRAATPTASLEPESGTRSVNASVVADGTASGSQAVKFTAGSGGGSCPVATTFTPDGPDPWGGCWPGEGNTGVPDGVILSNYSGPCTITAANTIINAQLITNCDRIDVQAAGVRITNSRIIGGLDTLAAPSTVYIADSEVHGPKDAQGRYIVPFRVVRATHTTFLRSEVTGGHGTFYCENDCLVENSLLHKQGTDWAEGGQTHFSAIRMDQYLTLRHSTIACEAGRPRAGTGCSADLTGYADAGFGPVNNNLIERNLIIGNRGGGATMCAYGGATPGKPDSNDPTNATYIRFISNRFVRASSGYCGNLGTILHFDSSRTGNVWTDNLYNDGAPISATGP